MNINDDLNACHLAPHQRGKRTGSREPTDSRKKQKYSVNVRDFLDIEALEEGSSDDEDSGGESVEDFVDDSTITRQEYLEGYTLTTSTNDGLPLDDRMTAVINRYEALEADRHSCGEYGFENKEMDMLTERFMRMPTEIDPCFWRVRVQEGSEEESFWALQHRWRVNPGLAYAIVLPSSGRMWIGVESTSRANVEELCENLSTFRHPLDISLVPIEERVTWLGWDRKSPCLTAPSWARLRKRSKLAELDLDRKLMKYAGDLVFVLETKSESKVVICLVPRLLVSIEGGASRDMDVDRKNKKRRIRLPRLLHPKVIGDPKEAAEIAPRMDPNVWWKPGRREELVIVGDGLYRFSKERRGDDEYKPPFAVFTVPVEALCSSGVVPRLSELNLFGEGMAVESNRLDFPTPSREFIQWTFEHFVAAPVEIGNTVEVDLKPGTLRGVIVDVQFEEAVVRLSGTAKEIQVEVERVRRIYGVGDAVKVVKGSNIDREGWVLKMEDDKLTVFDRVLKEEFHVKTWQLVPHDTFEWGFAHSFQVGHTVRVNSRISPHYGVVGKVCSTTDFSVEVIEAKMEAKFTVPPWFLEHDNSSIVKMGDGGSERSYDRYDELINTWVIVTGNRGDKGLFGRIQKNLGNQIMRVEASSGAKVVDKHVDLLVTVWGRDLRQYYVGRYHTPIFHGYSIPNFQRQSERPERATTPTPTQEEIAELEETPDAPITPSESGAAQSEDSHVPAEQEAEVPMICYLDQVLPVNWLTKHGLMSKRIYTHVRNTELDVFTGGTGFAKGKHEGDRALVLSGERLDEILVHVKKRTMKIPARFLFPEKPSSKGQVVVVINGDRAGEIYVTRDPREDGWFPLVKRGGKGAPKCFVEPCRLARCDPK